MIRRCGGAFEVQGGGVLAGVLAEVADDELRGVGLGFLHLLRGLAALIVLVRAPVVAPRVSGFMYEFLSILPP